MKKQYKDYIQDGVKNGLIRFYDDNKRIEYINEKKSRNYAIRAVAKGCEAR